MIKESTLSKWFKEGEPTGVHKVMDEEEFIVYKGFKITHSFIDKTYYLEDVRFSDIYQKVNRKDLAIMVHRGFIMGADHILYLRDHQREKDILEEIGHLYDRRAKAEKELPKDRGKNERRIRTVNNRVEVLADYLFLIQSRTKQYEIKYKKVMSRSNPRTTNPSPIKKRIEFKGDTGLFQFWNGEKNETLKKLDLILLDVKSSVTGWYASGKKGAQMYSNMVSDITKEELKVVALKNKHFDSNQVVFEGLYNKSEIEALGGDFTANIIGLADLGEGVETINLQLTGYALSTWVGFLGTPEMKNNGVYNYKISITKGEEEQRGKIKFRGLEFDYEKLSEEDSEMALKADVELQEYFAGKIDDEDRVPEPSEAVGAGVEDDADDLPF